MAPELREIAGLVVAALGGAAVGLEREWSGPASGPHARFAGLRTLTLLGGYAGIAGWFWAAGAMPIAVVLAAGAAALIVALSYAAAAHGEVTGTTDVAALVVLGAGLLSGAGELAIASGIFAAATLVLVEKSRLHGFVARIDDASLSAGVRFGVMAIVVLPLLPTGPYGPLGGVRPRELWAVVLFFTGISFAGFLARRVLGPRYGYAMTGLLGGLVSSTSVTFTFAGVSRGERGFGRSLAAGVLAANAVLFLRVLVILTVLGQGLVAAVAPYFVGPFVVAAVGSLLCLAWQENRGPDVRVVANPLQFSMALKMALVFQLVLFGVFVANEFYGSLGVQVSGAVVGFVDVDPLLLSMAHATGGVTTALAARTVAIGVLSNTVLKLLIAAFMGRGRFRWFTVGGLAALGGALGASLWILA